MPNGRVTFRVASFRHDQETSVEYKKFLTLRGLLRHIEHLAEETVVDYVSLRIIRIPPEMPPPWEKDK